MVARLGFSPLEDAAVELDHTVYHSAVLDFGPGSVDGWLAQLAAAELGIEDSIVLEPEAGELLLFGKRIALTPLEFAVMSYLHAKRGKVVTRVSVCHFFTASESEFLQKKEECEAKGLGCG